MSDWKPRKYLPTKESMDYVSWSDVVGSIGRDDYCNGEYIGDDPEKMKKARELRNDE